MIDEHPVQIADLRQHEDYASALIKERLRGRNHQAFLWRPVKALRHLAGDVWLLGLLEDYLVVASDEHASRASQSLLVLEALARKADDVVCAVRHFFDMLSHDVVQTEVDLVDHELLLPVLLAFRHRDCLTVVNFDCGELRVLEPVVDSA